MENQVILDPQWIIDSITYIMRDVKLHRFGRDWKAMELQHGTTWLNLVHRGILDDSLLKCLWIDRREHRGFLLQLMRKLGLFAELPIRSDKGEPRYFMPFMVSAVIPRSSDGGGGGGGGGSSGRGNAVASFSRRLGLEGCCAPAKPSDLPNPPFETLERLTPQPVCVGWLYRRSTEPDPQPYTVVFDFKGFLPNGFFERVVNRLVSDWPGGYEHNDPHIMWNAAELCVSDPKFRLVLIVEKDAHVISAVVADEHSERILPHVQEVADKVNEEFYACRIHFVCSFESQGGAERALRAHKVLETGAPAIGSNENSSETDPDFLALRTFFKGCGLSPKDADMYATAGLETDETVSENSLKRFYDACKENTVDAEKAPPKDFCDDLQESFGISKTKHQILICSRLAKMPPVPEPQKFLLGYKGGANLDHVQLECEQIERALHRAMLVADFMNLGTVADLHSGLGACTEHRVLHLAMHGHQPTLGGKHTLAFRDVRPLEPELLAKAIASGCIRDGGGAPGCIECVFINACFGSNIGERLKEHKVPWVVTWTTMVDDEAARTFAQSFYTKLSRMPSDFRSAFEFATDHMRLLGWLTDDDGGDPGPEGRPRLLERQRRENNIQLRAAGIPRLYEPTAIPIPKDQPREITFDVQDAGGCAVTTIQGAYPCFVALKGRLADWFFEPVIEYLHPRLQQWIALGNDEELERACKVAVATTDGAKRVILKCTVTAFGVAVHYGSDAQSQCAELKSIRDILPKGTPEMKGYDVRSGPNCELLSCLANIRILHFAAHGNSSLGIRQLIDGKECSLSRDVLIEKLSDRNAALQCIVLNVCESEELARGLIEEGTRFGSPCIIYWEVKILDAVMAQDFTKAFYRALAQYTHKNHVYRKAFEDAKEVMKAWVTTDGRRGYSDLDLAYLRFADSGVSSPEVASDATRNWRFAVNESPSAWTTVDRDRDFASLAGLHEKECLRALGICVRMQLADGSEVDIGQTTPGGLLHGLKKNRVEHTSQALCVLFGCIGVCPDSTHQYSGLWPDIASRARASSMSAIGKVDRPTAILRLEEAIWCRKWDLWCSQKADVATEHSLAACLGEYSLRYAGTGKISKNQQKRHEDEMSSMKSTISFSVRRGLKMGLTESAAADVAQAFRTEFVTKAASQQSFKDALDAAVDEAQLTRTTLSGDVTQVRPAASWNELTDSSPGGKWDDFVKGRLAHYAAYPSGKSTFEGHLAMVQALELCLAQLQSWCP